MPAKIQSTTIVKSTAQVNLLEENSKCKNNWFPKIIYKRVNCFTFISPFSSAQFSHSVVSDSFRPHGLEHSRPPCPSPTPRIYSNSCPLSQWCHPTISFSAVPFSSCLQCFPASVSFPMSQFFISGCQSFGASASASVLSMNIQDWFPLGLTGLISLKSKRLSSIFSNTTVQKHQFLDLWERSQASQVA